LFFFLSVLLYNTHSFVMASLRLIAFALPLLAGLVSAAKNPSSNIAFVSFPASYNEIQKGSSGAYHGFTFDWRKRCVQYCGSIGEHHLMSVSPLRVENTAAATCYCCKRDETTGNCYTAAHPYSSNDVQGPLTYCTPQVIKLMKPAIKTISSASIVSAPMPALTTKTAKPQAGKNMVFRWKGPASSLIDAKLYAKFSVGSTTLSVLLAPKTYDCIVPASIHGSKVSVTITSSSSANTAYQVAQGTFNIAKGLSKRDHEMRRVHA